MPQNKPPAWIITGPTAGIGRRTALAMGAHGTVVLVGRNASKLAKVEREITATGGTATSVVADMSDKGSVQKAAAEIVALDRKLAGLLNNAGTFPLGAATSRQGWDLAYATDHLGPFVLTETLLPHLPDGAHVAFIVSGVEDPDRKRAVMSGFWGSRYISTAASARGEWEPGGASRPGMDAYATSKQGNLATVLAFTRETPRIWFSALDPGFSPGSDLGRDSGAFLTFVCKYLLSPLAPMIKYWSTPNRAARVITCIPVDDTVTGGGYYDENGKTMLGSTQVSDPGFQDRVVRETRALLVTQGFAQETAS